MRRSIPKELLPRFPFLPIAVGVWLVSIACGIIDPRGEFSQERLESEERGKPG